MVRLSIHPLSLRNKLAGNRQDRYEGLLKRDLHPAFPVLARWDELVDELLKLTQHQFLRILHQVRVHTHTPRLIAILQIASSDAGVPAQERVFFHDAEHQVQAGSDRELHAAINDDAKCIPGYFDPDKSLLRRPVLHHSSIIRLLLRHLSLLLPLLRALRDLTRRIGMGEIEQCIRRPSPLERHRNLQRLGSGFTEVSEGSRSGCLAKCRHSQCIRIGTLGSYVVRRSSPR